MPLEFPYPQIGNRISTRRNKLKKTQEELANEVGFKRSSLANVERGNQRILIHQLYKIAKALDVDINTLLPEPEAKRVTSELNIKYETNITSKNTNNAQSIESDIAKIYNEKD